MAVFSDVSRISRAMTSFAPFKPLMSSYRRNFFFPRVRIFRLRATTCAYVRIREQSMLLLSLILMLIQSEVSEHFQVSTISAINNVQPYIPIYVAKRDFEDALHPDRSSMTHFGHPRALEEVRKIRPKHTLFTGMMHYDAINENLRKLMETECLDVQLSYDGLGIPVTL